jgi:hypothetical protein
MHPHCHISCPCVRVLLGHTVPRQTWTDYFNEKFQSVTTELLDEDKKAYQGSEEERNDVKAA